MTLVALAGGTVIQPSPSAAASTSPVLRVISWNICGEAGGRAGESGYCPFRNDPQYKVDKIVEVVTRHNANVLLLQEICGGAAGSHLARLADKLGAGWQVRHATGRRQVPEDIAYTPESAPTDADLTTCRGPQLDGDLGVAVAVKATIIGATIDDTVPKVDEAMRQQAPLLCVRTAEWTARICTTHVVARPLPSVREPQLRTIRSKVSNDLRDLVLGGDFNHFPTSPSPEFRGLGTDLDECDRHTYGAREVINENTHRGWDLTVSPPARAETKRDHIFASRPATGTLFQACDADFDRADSSFLGTTPSTGISDHAPLIGYLQTRTPGA